MTGGGDGAAEAPTRSPSGDGIRWDGVAALLVGLAVNELTLEWTVVPDGRIEAGWIRLSVACFQVLSVGLGLFVLVRRPGFRLPWARVGVAGGSALLAWFACFAALDLFAPGLAAGVPGLDYFDYRGRYRPDSALVMVPRERARSVEYRLDGDLAGADDGLPPLDVPYRASYNRLGFRANGGSRPYDVVVVGDSFVEFGEADSLTISEMLRRASGLSTFNLGRGWYGPHQYVELLRRHGLDLGAGFALLCYFEGNDPEDVVAYMDWRKRGSYRGFGLIEGNLLERFVRFNHALLSTVQDQLADSFRDRGSRRAEAGGRQTLELSLAGQPVTMRFAYRPDLGREPRELMEQDWWAPTRRQIEEFATLSRRNGIVPVIVFIPAKLTVYRDQRADGDSEAGRVQSSPRGEAVRRIAEQLGLAFLDLTPLFRRRAAGGELLYYRQDTHWTPQGRRVAADTIAAFLRARWPDVVDRRADGPAGASRARERTARAAEGGEAPGS